MGKDLDVANGQTIADDSGRDIYLNVQGDDLNSALQAAVLLGHESYRDGVDDGVAGQLKETELAAMAHTLMAKRIAGDYGAGFILSDPNLVNDLVAYSKGAENFSGYVNNTYDSSSDFWKLMKNDDGSNTIIDDGRGGVFWTDEDGVEHELGPVYEGGSRIDHLQNVLGLAPGDENWNKVNSMVAGAGGTYNSETGWFSDSNNPLQIKLPGDYSGVINELLPTADVEMANMTDNRSFWQKAGDKLGEIGSSIGNAFSNAWSGIKNFINPQELPTIEESRLGNLTVEQTKEYQKKLQSYGIEDIPFYPGTENRYDCADTALKFAGLASGNPNLWKQWTKNGNPLTKLTNVQASDFRDPANVDLFMDSETGGVDQDFWNSPNLAPGVVSMFTVRPNIDSTATGHVFTIQEVEYNDGILNYMKIIEGHMGKDPVTQEFYSELDFQTYLDDWKLDYYGSGTINF